MSLPKKRIHVAVGVVRNSQGEVLIAKRAVDSHQGGLWEFPGGKVERDESVQMALQRELKEELGISAGNLSPLIKIHHDYPELSVLLDVWEVGSFSGEAAGLQAQPLRWVPTGQLHNYNFPVANRSIITALRLTREMMITGDWENPAGFFQRLKSALDKGIRLIQLRAHHCSSQDYLQLFQQAKNLCDEYNALLVANTSLDIFYQLSAEALHLTSQRLLDLKERPVDKGILLSTSCHSWKEVQQAELIGADYILLGPVHPTMTHPEVMPLGIHNFSSLLGKTSLPVFALGGVQRKDKDRLLEAGAYGIAGISLYWQ